jgi:hypothetical protein
VARVMVLGEVRTTLLHHSDALDANIVERLLRLVPGRPVLMKSRPVGRAISADWVVGVDCALANRDRTKARAIGTVQTHATVTGGRILQGSARASVRRVADQRRLPWRQYLDRPGVLDVTTRADDDSLAEGFLDSRLSADILDLGALAGQVMEVVQESRRLDKRTTMRVRPRQLRWVAFLGGDESPTARIRDEADQTVTVRLTCGAGHLELATRFCEDLALHDWLLSTLQLVLRQAANASANGNDPRPLLRPALAQLVHLWLPGVDMDPAMGNLWEGLERHPGYSKQYDRAVTRIRDEISLQ